MVRFLCICSVLLLLLSICALSQVQVPESQRGILQGRVTDPVGLNLGEAVVTVENELLLGNKKRRSSTDQAGNYEIGPMPPGRYAVRVDKAGYVSVGEFVIVPPGSVTMHNVILVEEVTLKSFAQSHKALLIYIAVGVVAAIFWLVVLVDCVAREPSTGNEKIVWVILLVFIPLIGAIMYLLIRRPKRKVAMEK